MSPGAARIAGAGVLLLVLLLAFTPGIGAREDLGRHLLLGRLILETHRVPSTNLLTYTHPDFPFVDHHWLSEVWLFGVHHFAGLNGLIVWQMGMMVAALAVAVTTIRPRRCVGAYWLAGIAAAVILASRADVRPELFTFLCVALYGRLFEHIRRRDGVGARVAILALGALWMNLHIYFIFGLGMAAAFGLERCCAAGWARTTWVREGSWLVALVVLSGLGPNGIGGLLFPLRIFSNYGVLIGENASPVELLESVLSPMLLVLPLFSLAVVAAIARVCWSSPGRVPPRLADLIAAGAGLVAAWTMARSAPLLALTGLPVIGAALSIPGRAASPRLAWLGKAAVAAAALVNVLLAHAVIDGHYSRAFPAPIYPTPLGFDDETRYVDPLRTLVERHGLAGPVFTDYNAGSLVEYALFPEPGYVDNRPEAFPESFWRDEYQPAMTNGAAWEAVSARRRFNVVVVSLGAGDFVQALLRRGGWILVHVDDVRLVLVRDDAQNAAIIGALGWNADRLAAYEADVAARIDALAALPWWRRPVEAERIVYRLLALDIIGERGRLWPYLARLHAAYPDYQLVEELMTLAAPAAEAGTVRRLMAARARWPVSVKQVVDEASALVADGNPEAAKAVLERGRRFFPLSPVLRTALASAPR